MMLNGMTVMVVAMVLAEAVRRAQVDAFNYNYTHIWKWWVDESREKFAAIGMTIDQLYNFRYNYLDYVGQDVLEFIEPCVLLTEFYVICSNAKLWKSETLLENLVVMASPSIIGRKGTGNRVKPQIRGVSNASVYRINTQHLEFSISVMKVKKRFRLRKLTLKSLPILEIPHWPIDLKGNGEMISWQEYKGKKFHLEMYIHPVHIFTSERCHMPQDKHLRYCLSGEMENRLCIYDNENRFKHVKGVIIVQGAVFGFHSNTWRNGLSCSDNLRIPFYPLFPLNNVREWIFNFVCENSAVYSALDLPEGRDFMMDERLLTKQFSISKGVTSSSSLDELVTAVLVLSSVIYKR